MPDKLPVVVADRQDAQIPDREHLSGMIGSRIQNSAINRLLPMDVDRLLEGFRKRPGRQSYDGEHVGKWLHAATLAWVYTGNAQLRAKLDNVVKELLKCQLDDGYLGTYLPKTYWTEWDVWSHKYDLIGLLTYVRYTGNTAPLAGCRKIGDLLCNTFGDGPGKRDIIKAGEHVGMAPGSVLEPMVWLYRLTGEKKYGDFCQYILRAWEHPNGPHIVSRLLDGKGVNKVGNAKAYEMLSCINGMLEWYRTTGDSRYLRTALNAWEDIVAKRLYITGTASAGEVFHGDHELVNTGSVGETCVTVTWLQLNAHLLRLTGEARFAEQLERVVYNQLCGAQRPDGKAWGYYVEMEGKKPYTATLDGQCCLSSGPRGLALVPTFAITTDADGAVVNFYDAGRAKLRLRDGTAVKLTIETQYPASSQIAIAVDPAEEHEFTVKLRIPAWCARPSLRVNGEAAEGKPAADGYAALKRSWKPGDKIELAIPLEPRLVLGDHKNLNKAAVLYGPLVLAADTALTGGKHINSIKLASRDLAELDVSPEPLPQTFGKLGRRSGIPRQCHDTPRSRPHSHPIGAVCRCRRNGHTLQGVAAVAVTVQSGGRLVHFSAERRFSLIDGSPKTWTCPLPAAIDGRRGKPFPPRKRRRLYRGRRLGGYLRRQAGERGLVRGGGRCADYRASRRLSARQDFPRRRLVRRFRREAEGPNPGCQRRPLEDGWRIRRLPRHDRQRFGRTDRGRPLQLQAG